MNDHAFPPKFPILPSRSSSLGEDFLSSAPRITAVEAYRSFTYPTYSPSRIGRGSAPQVKIVDIIDISRKGQTQPQSQSIPISTSNMPPRAKPRKSQDSIFSNDNGSMSGDDSSLSSFSSSFKSKTMKHLKLKPKRLGKLLDLALPGSTRQMEEDLEGVPPLSPPALTNSSYESAFSSFMPPTPLSVATAEYSVGSPEVLQEVAEDMDGSGEHAFDDLKVLVYRGRSFHHPYRREEAPYMQSYSSVSLHNDYYAYDLLQRLCPPGSPTFHDYGEQPPAQVLDLGCGEGYWAAGAASNWGFADTKVTAFDLVDLGSAVRENLEPELATNMTWVRGNFISKALPFKDNTFDLVRMANLTLAIPISRWADLLIEVRRVLKPGGRLELIDDQLFFPEVVYPFDASDHIKNSHQSSSSLFDDSFEEEDLSCTTTAGIGSPESSVESFFSADDSSVFGGTILHDSPEKIDPTTPPHKQQQQSESHHTSCRRPFAEFESKANAAKDMEMIFENMLVNKYNVSLHPHEFLEQLLRDIFGQENGRLMCTIPIGVPISEESSSEPEINARSTTSLELTRTRRSADDDRPKLSRIDWGKEGKRLGSLKETNKLSPPSDPNAMNSMPFPSGPLPETIPSKAAKLLGGSGKEGKKDSLEFPKGSENSTSFSSVDWEKEDQWFGSVKERKRLPVRDASLPSQTPFPEVMSSKAAKVLLGDGKEHQHKKKGSLDNDGDDLGRAASPFIEDRIKTMTPKLAKIIAGVMSMDKPKSARPYQPPGLIVLSGPGSSSMFMPFTPGVLEMHALRNVHVLLSCKYALENYVKEQKDESEEPILSEAEFDGLICEYESFKRRRMNWPQDFAEVLEAFEYEPVDVTPTATVAPVKSNPFFRLQSLKDDEAYVRQRAHSTGSAAFVTPAPENTVRSVPLPKFGDHAVVRNIRVFEAVKGA